jgi:hypothetical protein
MVHLVNLRLATILAASALALGGVAVARAQSNGGPSQSQIQTAVRHAERSSTLWATVNICNTSRYPNVIGIRAQMPSLGFNAQLSMSFEVEYWSTKDQVFKVVPGAGMSVPVGTSKLGLRQSGVQLSFVPHAGQLRGVVQFQWSRGGQLIGSTGLITTPGHPDADFGDPAHHSSSECLIG